MPTEPTISYFSVTPELQSETRTGVFPREMQGRQQAGTSSQQVYSGQWADMSSLMSAQLATGSLAQQVQATLSRQPGGLGQLTITRTDYISATDPGGGGGGSEPSMQAQDVGTSEQNPEYSYEFAEVQEPIMTHPAIAAAGLSQDALSVLAYLSKGGQLTDNIWLSGGNQLRVNAAIAYYNIPLWLVMLVQIPNYLDVKVTLTASWSVDPTTTVSIPTALAITTPPGPIQTPLGRNWLYVGGSYQIKGSDCKLVKKYILSGPGGWDSRIYPSNV